MTQRRVYIDEDNGHFYYCHPSEDMTVKGLENLVDTYAKGQQLAGIIFCANVQRALFNSAVWEPLYADYDPNGGPDQPCLQWLAPESREMKLGNHGRQWIHNLWLLNERGIDHPQVWLNRCKHHNIEGWLSMRMNDCHHNPAKDAFWHPEFWRANPKFHRADHRDEGWFETAYDFNHPEVVEHHMKLIRELLSRYDMSGFEVDWMRWGKNFKPGEESIGRAVLTDMMRDIKALVKASEEKWGHPIKLATRLPAHPADAYDWGYDVYTWAKEGLVDTVICGVFLEQTLQDFRLEQWRALFGDKVSFICQVDAGMHAFPNAGKAGKINDYDFSYGSAACALQSGADGVLFFNECYREGPADGVSKEYPELLNNLLSLAGDASTLRNRRRRMPLTYSQTVGPGMPVNSPLPIPVTRPEAAYDYSRFRQTIPLKLNLGYKPDAPDLRVVLALGFDSTTPELEAGSFPVWINSKTIAPHKVSCKPSMALWGQTDTDTPRIVAQLLTFDCPYETLFEGVNLVEFTPPEVQGLLVWAELKVIPKTMDL